MLDDISSSRRTVAAGCLRQISCAIQFLFDFEFLFLRSLLHLGACEGCFRGVYQNPPEGTGVTFVEIADVFATCLTLSDLIFVSTWICASAVWIARMMKAVPAAGSIG